MKTVVNCKRCKDRDICEKPCAALDAQLKRDFPLNIDVNASPRFPETPGELGEHDVWKAIEDLSHNYNANSPTYREKAMLILDLSGVPREEISKIFGIKRDSVRKIIYAAKCKLRDR